MSDVTAPTHTRSPHEGATKKAEMRRTARAPWRVAVYGAGGRMGREVCELLERQSNPSLTLELRLGRADDLSSTHTQAQLERCDALIDLSLPSATTSLLTALMSLSSPPALISGVTGLSEAQLALMHTYSERAPTLYARNFSLGVALLSHLTELSARVLGEAFDVEVFELHHRQKLDAPSGTALQLAERAAEGKRSALDEAEVNATRSTAPTTAPTTTTTPTAVPRDPHLVHVSAGRGGQVIGEHTVYFLGEAERVELTHRAQNRALFAHGALRATHWLLTQQPAPLGRLMGLQDMISALLSPHALHEQGGRG